MIRNNNNNNNGGGDGSGGNYMPPTEDGGDIVPSAMDNDNNDRNVINPHDHNNNNNNNHNNNYSSSTMMSMAMERQDSMMDQLSMGLNRLQQQSSMISEETGLHSQLLNDMENHMDNAHEILGIEARRAAQLRAQDGQLWKLQLTVAALLVTLVILLLLGTV